MLELEGLITRIHGDSSGFDNMIRKVESSIGALGKKIEKSMPSSIEIPDVRKFQAGIEGIEIAMLRLAGASRRLGHFDPKSFDAATERVQIATMRMQRNLENMRLKYDPTGASSVFVSLRNDLEAMTVRAKQLNEHGSRIYRDPVARRVVMGIMADELKVLSDRARDLKLNFDPAGALGAINTVQGKVGGLKGLLLSMKGMLGMIFAVPLGTAGAAMFSMFTKLDDEVTRATAIMGDSSGKSKQGMLDTVFGMSNRSPISAYQLVEAYTALLRAGVQVKDVEGELSVVERFAVATHTDATKAAINLTNAMMALELRTGNAADDIRTLTHLTDLYTKASQISNISAEKFSEMFEGRLAGAMRQIHMTVDEGAAIMTTLAKMGVPASQLTMSMETFLRNLDLSAQKHNEAWNLIMPEGKTPFDSTGKFRPVADIFEDVEKRFGGASDKARRAILSMFGIDTNIRTSSTTLMGFSQIIRQLENDFKGLSGTTDKTAKIVEASFMQQMSVLGNKLAKVAYDIGSALTPAMMGLNLALSISVGLWNMIPKPFQYLIVNIPILIGLVWGLKAALLGLKAGVIWMVPYFMSLGAILLPLIIPSIVAFAAGIGVWLLLMKSIGIGVKDSFEMLGDGLQSLGGFFENFTENWQILGNWLSANWGNIWKDMMDIMSTAWAYSCENLKRLFDNVAMYIEYKIRQLAAYLKEYLNPAYLWGNIPNPEVRARAAMNTVGTPTYWSDYITWKQARNSELISSKWRTTEFPGFNWGGKLQGDNSSLEHFLKKAIMGDTLGDLAGGAGKAGDTFKERNLSRFTLEGLGGLSRGMGPQEVTDKGLEKQIEALVKILSERGVPTIIGP